MLIDQIKQAGVVGAGGAGFPTHVKLNAEAECFIVNAAECEPLIETDKFFCRNFTDELIEGAVLIGKHLKAKRIVIGLKREYEKEVAALRACIERKNAPVELFLMDAFYPTGDEQVLVQMVTGRSVPERGIPLAVGAVVDNVGTVLNIYNAVKGEVLTEKYLSVSGAVEKPVMIKTPIGTPIVDCIEAAKPTTDDYEVILGGPMMGKLVFSRDDILKTTVTKTTSNLLVLPKGHYLPTTARKPMNYNLHLAKSACLQCRYCTTMCPRYRIGHDMQPHKIMRAVFLEKNVEDNEQYLKLYGSAMNCSECGVCEMYACPMGLAPRKVNKYLKGKLREKNIDVPKNPEPTARELNMAGRAATSRLIARLGLTKYYAHADDNYITLSPERVTIPMAQHIGKPADPVVAVGNAVSRGTLIGKAADGALSANIHASIDGVVETVDNGSVTIRQSK